MHETTTPSLFERIGGKEAVRATVEVFYQRVMSDESLTPFFDGVDLARQRAKQRAFLNFAFGGRTKYEGKDLRNAHALLVQRGLGKEHFLAVAGHLAAALAELDVPSDLIAEVMAIAASTHDDVLGF